jgi:predicted flavoprotein YhiN
MSGVAEAQAARASGEAAYLKYCASCHEQVSARIPTREALTKMSASRILRTLDFGLMMSIAYPMRRDEREAVLGALTALPLPVTGHEGYRKAEVTGGGVALSEVDPVTMESRRAPGLFLCGEMLDAFGPIGGYNFLWAWATGRAAGLGARRRLTT